MYVNVWKFKSFFKNFRIFSKLKNLKIGKFKNSKNKKLENLKLKII